MTNLVSQVLVDGIREGKNGVFYADFLLLGGSISVPVESNQIDQVKNNLHQEVKAVFKTTPRQRVVFGDRSVTVFEPVSLIEFNPVN